MASLIFGYNYDIFISYRQKDNKGDRWVSLFVEALKTELDSIFKEDVSVYYDENPHDRLQDTHNVDKSLKEKLKCLIFIPVLSQTYCDPDSYAWKYEFLPFLKMIKDDSYGRDILLKNGNYASRILPVRIHEIEKEDIKLFESETGSPMRTIDFVYRTSAGVNRPLRENEEFPAYNLNKLSYRDQVNKVANAIKEIITGIKNLQGSRGERKQSEEKPSDDNPAEAKGNELKKSTFFSKGRIIWPAIIIALLAIAGISLLPEIFRKEKLGGLVSRDGKVSIAVMPFQNLTNDTIWDVWQDGIKDNLISYLSNYSVDFSVRQTESVNGVLQNKGLVDYASLTPSVSGNISRQLDANIFISGSIFQAGHTVRVNANLVNSKTEEAFKSFQIEGTTESDVFPIIDSLSGLIKDYLSITVMQKDIVTDFRWLISTNSAEAYRCYMYGTRKFYKYDWEPAKEWFLNAVEADTNFTEAIRMLYYTYGHLDMLEEEKSTCLELHRKKDRMTIQEKIWADVVYADFFETPYEEIKYLGLLIELDYRMPVAYSMMAGRYAVLEQYDKAISLYQKELEIYDQWGSRPRWSASYTTLGKAYHITGQTAKEKRLYIKAENEFPDDYEILYRQAVLSLSEGNENEAANYIDKYARLFRINISSEVDLSTNLANIYQEGGNQDKAEEYFRYAYSLETGSIKTIINLAWFLINSERNIDEGMTLVNNALNLNPGNWQLLQAKGWGLYKLGKNQEALNTLQRSWDAKPWYYSHALHVQIEEVKKTLAAT
jgi:TolB-like protein/Tfp pilus assembly protein PilF